MHFRIRDIKAECLKYIQDVLMMRFYKLKVGSYYMLQNGTAVEITGRYYGNRGYETVNASDGRHRYDRSTHTSCTGRCTGTAHDYGYPFNLARPFKEVDYVTFKALEAPHKNADKKRWMFEQECA